MSNNSMVDMTRDHDVELEIAELEYDVGGVGSLEPTDSQVNYTSIYMPTIGPRYANN